MKGFKVAVYSSFQSVQEPKVLCRLGCKVQAKPRPLPHSRLPSLSVFLGCMYTRGAYVVKQQVAP